MRPTLLIGDVYNTKDYGLARYEGTCSTNRGGAGFLHKFRPSYGPMKYIQVEELHLFLAEAEYAM